MTRSLRWLMLALVAAFLAPQAAPAQDSYFVYVGTYTGKKSKGIYMLELDRNTGKLSEKAELAAEIGSPNFLAVHPRENYLYAVGDPIDAKAKAGSINAFTIDPKTGKLTFLNRESSVGSGPCHLVVDQSGQCVLAANYGGGSVIALPITEGGKLGPASSFHQHKGSSVDKGRQEGPHAHSINVDVKNDYAFAADLGIDKVLVYKLDAAKAKLAEHGFGAVPPGGGPRHLGVAPNSHFVYVCNELTSTVTTFGFDDKKGTLSAPLQTLSTLPEGMTVKGNSTAECVVHPSGKFVYVSNRGHDSIAMFAIGESGTLKALGHAPTGGKTPRNFTIDPSGQFLLAANQSSDSIVVFRVDMETGMLKATGQTVEVPAPVCVRFVIKGR